MKKKTFLMLGMSAALLASCCNDDYAGNVTNGSQSEATAKTTLTELRGSINPAMTRAINEEWEDGDAIGVYGKYADGSTWFTNDKFSLNASGKFETANLTHFYKNQDAHAITAYYPYDENVTAESPLISFWCQEQWEKEILASQNFMFASGTTTRGSVPNLTFKHAMAKVVFNFYLGEGVTADEFVDNHKYDHFASLDCRGGGTFNTMTGEVVTTIEDNMNSIWMREVSEAVSRPDGAFNSIMVLLPPQTLEKATNLHLFNGEGYEWNCSLLDTTTDNKWLGGYAYTYNVVINKNKLTIISADIKPWISTSGGTVYPE